MQHTIMVTGMKHSSYVIFSYNCCPCPVIIICARNSFQPTMVVPFPTAFKAALSKFKNPTNIQALWSAVERQFGDSDKLDVNHASEHLLVLVQQNYFGGQPFLIYSLLLVNSHFISAEDTASTTHNTVLEKAKQLLC
jgi:hypothetical protein